MDAPPPDRVLDAFGADDVPRPLAGGRGLSWRAGSIVLKPLDWSPQEHAWHADVLARIEEDGFRVARPDPRIVDGWTAATYVEGTHEPGRWRDIIAAGERFHASLAALPRPDAIIDSRTNPWSIGDRVAFGEVAYPALADVLAVLGPVTEPSQVVHGDLTGNVLFHHSLPPAIIDFAPYWRPTEYASAIVVADALNWEGAPDELAEAVDRRYLLRALVFRGVTTLAFGGGEPVPEIELARRIARCASL
ncbi:MAG: hypothetical protein QOF43_1774 [Gaiellaceae bacterium]|nr:hypothetical protein [Gaiellaceae bacterium]